VEIGRIAVQGQPEQKVSETPISRKKLGVVAMSMILVKFEA
jgi:hypothetical protein